MTGRAPSGRACAPSGLSRDASQAEPLVPNAENKLTVCGFIQAMRDRFEQQAAIAPNMSLEHALASLEAWEVVFEEPVELTEECAHAIVDSELEHWETD